MELSYGASFGDEDERRNVQNALRMYPIVELNATLATRAGRLLASADRDAGGESGIDRIDPLIAAVADVYDEPVLTTDGGHFEEPGVAVETYLTVRNGRILLAAHRVDVVRPPPHVGIALLGDPQDPHSSRHSRAADMRVV